ncbi:Hypothetical protein A7982_06420 [Minicystis rosea]|nr:Hypothetical protein A7982_06420 [Minicystis rosea]
MPTWDELRARDVPCLRCRSAYAIAGPLSAAARERVKAAVDAGLVIDAIRWIREDTGAGLGEAKALHEHFVRKQGRCHHCGGALATGELVDCPACGALNVAW